MRVTSPLWTNRARVIEDILGYVGPSAIRSAVKGDEVWTVETTRSGTTIIVVYVVTGGPIWSFREIPEVWGPTYYRCPLKFLDLAPEANAGWRATLRAQ